MFDMNGMLGFGFDNFEDANNFMQEMLSWRAVKQEPEKAAAFLKTASTHFKEGMLSSIHDGFMQTATVLMSSLRTATLMGMPEALVTQIEGLLHEAHAWVDEASEHLSDTPAEEKQPTISPEEDSVAFSILGQVNFGDGWV